MRTCDRSGEVDRVTALYLASGSLLTMMVATVAGYEPGEFVHTFADAHLRVNHLEPADLQLAREPYPLPRVRLRRTPASLLDFRYEDIELLEYRCHPAIRAPVSV